MYCDINAENGNSPVVTIASGFTVCTSTAAADMHSYKNGVGLDAGYPGLRKVLETVVGILLIGGLGLMGCALETVFGYP